MKTFKLPSKFSGLKPSILKYEVADICSLKKVKMVVAAIKCFDLTTETIKILGAHFSYNQKLQIQKFVKSITNMQAKCFEIMENKKYYTGGESKIL